MEKNKLGLTIVLLIIMGLLAACNEFGSPSSSSEKSSYSTNNYDRKYSDDEIHSFVNQYKDSWGK